MQSMMKLDWNWHKWMVLVGLALSARPIVCDYSTITYKFGTEAVELCNEKCPFQNRTGDSNFDLSCGPDCSIQQCALGCSLWKQGLEQSCQTTCNVTSETVVSRELYCVMGCNEALNTYFQKLRDLIGIPPSPALVADSLTATALSLLWEAPHLANLSYLAQWRYEELTDSWQYCNNHSRPERSIVHVDHLRPYTKYRFRIAIFLSSRGATVEPVYSAQSVVISTLESGKPSSPPYSLRAVALDDSRVSISWKPGPFPNGPLISYVLRLADTQPNSYTALEDMPASNNTLFYMFQNLSPAREYEVSVAMRNAVGEGPRAVLRVSTPPSPSVMPSQQPILILGGEQRVLAAQANDMLSDPVELYSTEFNISGVGIDVSRDYLFVSISNGYVYRSSLSKKSKSIPILTPDTISYKPLDLSVDWLNKHLYILGEVYYTREGSHWPNTTKYSNWEIQRCDFDGKNQLVALAGFNSRPIHFEVDPYNGYIFWALRGVERGGLYRLDLANISNGVPHDAPPELILRDAHLGTFTVDHTDFRLLVANRRQNRTVLAVSLDGREVNDLRRNTQTPMFELVRSMAFAGGLFYWTNGNEMLTEEYHAETDSYYHNEFHVVFNTKRVATRQVLVALRSCQPIPVPVNPPIGVQSVMGVNKAKISWSVPHLLGHQGSGAWQQWGFHLQLTHASTGDIIERRGINGTTFIIENLKEDSEYIFKVAAVTESGSGPWSSEFVGSTLPSNEATSQSTLIWSGPDGLLETDLTGDNMNTLIHSSHLKNILITDITWYRDKLYLVTNISNVLWYNTTSHEKGLMSNMDHVGSLAIDWVGKRIYWSNPKQQLITRGNLDGGNREPVPIVTVAKELVIDSLSAYIYWNTGHAVEAARLNGESKMVYYPAQLFSGKQVMGITADLENKYVYWIVRSYDGSELHRAPTADRISTEYDVSQSVVTRLSGASSMSSLRYFSGRLAWVRDSSRAVLSDATGRYCAELQPRVRAIAVREPTLHKRSVDLVAIPEAINKSSILVTGVWDKFNVSWSPAEHVNHGRVFYDVSLHFHGHYKIEKTLEHPWIVIRERSVPPYSVVEVSVRAHTAWGAGAATSVVLRTPQAAPAAPRAPRVYLLHKRNGATDAIFRWDPPVRSNGVILSFETKCWTTPVQGSTIGSTSCGLSHLPKEYHQQLLSNILPNTTYNFKVRAYTEAGFGFYSDTVSCSSDDVNPVPKILMSSQEFIKIIDLDDAEVTSVPKITGMPVDFGVSIEEKMIYWSNNLEEIFASHFLGGGHYKLLTTNGSTSSLTVDWIGRVVYWAQYEPMSSLPHAVYRAILGLPQSRAKSLWILSTKQPVYNLQVSPLDRTLYWYQATENHGYGRIMMSNTDGSSITPFFNRSLESDCDCPEDPQVSRPFVIDISGDKKELFWVDPWVGQIVASDMDGCHCRTVVDTKLGAQVGFPPVSITVDSRNIYWYNATEKQVYYRDKYRLAKVNQIKTVFGSKILALDSANQPYPTQQCLLPEAKNLTPQVITNSANSITIELPEVKNAEECSKFDTATTEYTIYYQADLEDSKEEPVMSVSTVDKEVVLTNLMTFTNYVVHVEALNYYSKHFGVPPLKSASVVLQTAAEAPAAAEDVTATVLSPVLARVEWGARPDVWYQLYWATNQSDHSQHKFQEHNTFPVSEGRAANMSHLSPNTSYVVWVRACSNYSKVYTDSNHISVHTYPLPTRIMEHNISAYSILVKWDPPTAYSLVSSNVEYSDGSINWLSCSQTTIPDVWSATNLEPRTSYYFRLRLQYAIRGPPYYWPQDDRFKFVTLGDVPGAPGMPRVQAVDSRVLRAWWSEPEPHGYPVTWYRVWGRPGHRTIDISDNATENIIDHTIQNLPDDIDEDFKSTILKEGLILLYNGSDNYWLISSEAASGWSGGWRVCVQARNELGWGPVSLAVELSVPPAAAPPAAAAALLAAAAALAALVAAVAAAMFYVYKNRLRKKKAALQNPQTNVIRRGPDVELATLRQLPIRHSNNILYNQGLHAPSDAELAALPHISREQITLHKFLGSGAFGEVFEGVARNLHAATEDTKVAVKTLRKGATEQEKTEFLQEAALMSNFKHEHILRLLGVCLDNDPNYIIMELMEGGDLLSYLRAKRTSLYSRDSLTLRELLSMCVDVTRGCRYLEEMHFVHRDLAARNCLVATRNEVRVVKIGDFGLARDIYRNDYYRKAGEGLLPVRWMAVECLVDGVFSCQSDVWAWAVLCWEVLSLGQQPYPARTNRQVLAYVRAGGTPDRPPNCPTVLYELLQQCWSYAAEQRPSFKHCLEVVTALRDKTSSNITLSAISHPPHYLTLIASELAVDNRTYLLDENENSCIDEDIPEVMEPSRLLPSGTPKYLELMYDSDSGTFGDGYEVPRSPAPLAGPLLSRRSTGEYTRRSPHSSCHRSLSLRQSRPTNATIIPLRNGIVKRASLCDSLHGPFLFDATEHRIEKHLKTPL